MLPYVYSKDKKEWVMKSDKCLTESTSLYVNVFLNSKSALKVFNAFAMAYGDINLAAWEKCVYLRKSDI